MSLLSSESSQRVALGELIHRENSRVNGALIPTLQVDAYLDKVLARGECLLHLQRSCLAGALLGYCNAPDKDLAYVSLLIVAEQTRGQGIGETLLDAFVSMAAHRGFSRIQLEVDVDNQAAISLYNKFGFYYIHSDNLKLLMQLSLPGRNPDS
ncbi:GNAT family N-acetyltransferase [Billgrantia kenyensis]|uniref:GNAT family N-acetyltransferase n=1 Tax=Billgrantia kenyensis TaxID=321266 RepID=A0A7V9W508_9GAMM|nr:GNAT family N-acetyltransferase [Halomonas kenyensis]MBA2781155.1 GNAT family N-acetyltransferase [Halomonas kenyensis]MCG6663849.1 GNAT family N-acetyltransferase [Halomonas kenyensis]